MKVLVKFFASFREIARERERLAGVTEGSTPANLLADPAREVPALDGIRSSNVCAVNGDYVAGDHPLREGDEVAFIPPVSGVERMYDVTDQELSVEAVAAKVKGHRAAPSRSSSERYVTYPRGARWFT